MISSYLFYEYNVIRVFKLIYKRRRGQTTSYTLFENEDDVVTSSVIKMSRSPFTLLCYLLTNWLAYLYGRIQSPRPDVMPDRREGITRAAGFVFACIHTQTS